MRIEDLESKLKELKLQKRELVLASKRTENIDIEIKDIEDKMDNILVSKK